MRSPRAETEIQNWSLKIIN